MRYELAAEEGGTRLTVTQDKLSSQEDANRIPENWQMVLAGMKKMLEG